MKTLRTWLMVCGLLLVSPRLYAQYTLLYSTNGNVITLTGYTGTLGAVSIPNFVTIIGQQAFLDSTSLTKVIVPDSVATIGPEAFCLCTRLTNVTIGTNVTTIGGDAFYECTKLTSLTFGNGAADIESGAFYGCVNLTALTIGNGSTSIAIEEFSQGAGFKGCPNLTSVTISNGVTSIGAGAFYYNTNLSSVILSDGLTNIGGSSDLGAFQNCYALNNINIPLTVATIGQGAFVGCGLTNITIPASVTSIGEEAFYICLDLTNVFFEGNAPDFGVGEASFTFLADASMTAYYLPGTSGWSPILEFRYFPLALWNPTIRSSTIHSNQFNFTITGTPNIPIQIAATTNLASGTWTPLQTCTLTNGSIQFSDAMTSNYASRFYTVQFP